MGLYPAGNVQEDNNGVEKEISREWTSLQKFSLFEMKLVYILCSTNQNAVSHGPI